VHRLLGTASDERLVEIAEEIIGRRPDNALQLFEQALAEGGQLGELVDQLLNYQRDLMVTAAGSQSTALLSVASNQREKVAEQAKRWGLPTIVAALQIWAETKTRMQRSGHGRALAELAVVRLTLLEATLDLANLAEELRSSAGSLPAPKSPPVPVSRPKRVVRSLPEPSDPLPSPPVSEKRPSIDPLEAGQEQAFWSQVISSLPVRDMLREAAGKVANVATIGPNHLEVLFPSAYYVCKGLCEKPPGLERLEKLAAELAGRPVKITCRLEDPPEGLGQPVKPTPQKASEAARVAPTEVDPYADKARAIFGAKVVRVEPVSAPKQDSEAVEE
jgi:DNA polymerase III subunit gamma/tau